MKKTYDVIALGLGGVGSAAACHLASRGKRVLGLERYTPAHDRGSSHGGSRIIRQAYFENPKYVPLALQAYQLWERLERDTNSDLLRVTGGLFLGEETSNVVSGSLHSAREHGLEHELMDAVEIRRRFPALHPRTKECALYERKAGFLRPEAAITAHLQQAAKHGAELHVGEPVSGWSASAGHVLVTTEKTTYEAAHLVIAPGAWAADLLKFAVPFLHVRRHVMAWFEPKRDARQFAPESFPIYVWQTGKDKVFYGFPVVEGLSRGVKAAMHSGGDICTPDAIDRTILDRDIVEIREQLAGRIPSLNGRLLHASTCMYTMTPDEDFVVSLHPDFSNVSIACGFSGHGFKFSSVLGEILADLAMEGHTRHAIDFLAASRLGSSEALSEN
jgi:sarcosine oxidase